MTSNKLLDSSFKLPSALFVCNLKVEIFDLRSWANPKPNPHFLPCTSEMVKKAYMTSDKLLHSSFKLPCVISLNKPTI